MTEPNAKEACEATDTAFGLHLMLCMENAGASDWLCQLLEAKFSQCTLGIRRKRPTTFRLQLELTESAAVQLTC